MSAKSIITWVLFGSAVSVLFLGSLAFSGGAEPISSKRVVFENTACELNDSCHLKSVNYELLQYKVDAEGYAYGTRLITAYETDDVAHLEEFAVVQFIQGCQYSSCLENGQVRKSLDFSRWFFDNIVIFKHPKMVIDSEDQDPVYNSMSEYPDQRHYAYRWNTDPNSFDNSTERYYGLERPSFPKLYVIDRPGQAMVFDSGSVSNVSFKLKTCIYKTKDVPKQTTPDNTQFAEPIHCMEWPSSFLYNFATGEFESPAELDPVCL